MCLLGSGARVIARRGGANAADEGRPLDFPQCFSDHYSNLAGFAYRMLGCRESAEDAAQEAFLRLARKGDARLEGEAARRWLFVVTRNLCMSQLRKRGREVSLETAPEQKSGLPTPREEALARERERLVREALGRLAPPLREVVALREYEEMSYAEIAEVAGCSVGAVRSRLSRAREELREILKPLLEEKK